MVITHFCKIIQIIKDILGIKVTTVCNWSVSDTNKCVIASFQKVNKAIKNKELKRKDLRERCIA